MESFVLDQAKTLLLEDGGWLRGPEIMARNALHSRTRPAHPGALLYEWVWERRLFVVSHQDIDYFPAFGLTYSPALTPLPGLAGVIAILGSRDWTLAAWFSLPHDALAGRRPRDLLLEQPAQVIAAAKQTNALRYHIESTKTVSNVLAG